MIREEALKRLTAAKDDLTLGEFSKVNDMMSVGEYLNAVTRTVDNYPATHVLTDQIRMCVQRAVQNQRYPSYD